MSTTRIRVSETVTGGRPIPATARRDGQSLWGQAEYYLLGDNSRNSQDARLSFASGNRDPVGPHLKQAEREGHFQYGTVPADQMLGRAFFVYWPGFMMLSPTGHNLLPDLGRARWIR